ncbi:MAG TPA: mandelate racemase/muconate lactonizing enzyme family protein [Terriglobales bacterium]|jgi:D-galactarolactone cycloisomerase|nr:mandelate racemase/muconate lactonizing enzyme family protein [Terriglobales bacterium]
MKITDVKTIRLRATIPTEGQVFSRSGVRSTRSTTLVRVDTDEGISGIGSCSGNGELIEVIVSRVLKPMLLGMDPTDIESVWDKAYVRGGHKEFGTRGIGMVALSGVDIALWDILGKARGVPLYQLLGGKVRDRVPVYATALYPEEPAKVAARARAFADQGFHGVKIKVGFDLAQDIEIVRAVRRELGDRFIVMTDANQGYSRGAGLKAAAAFAECGAFWLEEPLFVEDIEGHATLREKARVPIAVGENLHSHYAFENFIVRGAVDFIQPDVARAGGISEIKKIVALAARHRVPVSFHTWGDAVALAASVHLSAALKDCIVMELDYTYNPLREELLSDSLKVQSGFLTPPEKPGLGIELDPQACERFAFVGAEELAIRQKTLL